MLLQSLVEAMLTLLDLLENCPRPPRRPGIKSHPVRVTPEPLKLLPQLLQLPLRLLHRILQLLVLRITIQELMHDVHDIGQPGDFTDFLKTVLSFLRFLDLFVNYLLQAVPCQLLHRPQFPQAPSRCIEGFIRRFQGDLMPPSLEIVAASNRRLHGVNGVLHFSESIVAQLALVMDLVVQLLQLVLDLDTLLVLLSPLLLLLHHLVRLALQMGLHLQKLLLKHGLLFLNSLKHVLKHLLLRGGFSNLVVSIR
mmetsp:Transcript_55820/g.122282  ORF Transcript_55820/g.122282 Transcript_55820/m.122282 type:complete len:252 (-) Transcript_55820:421-1176(-)